MPGKHLNNVPALPRHMAGKSNDAGETKQGKEAIGFVIHPTYTVERDAEGKEKAVVLLWARLKDGRSALIRKSFKPYFFIREDDEKEALKAIKDGGLENRVAGVEKTDLRTLANTDESPPDGFKVTKIVAILPRDVKDIRKLLEESGIKCYEADIRFAYRAMMDWGVHSTFRIKNGVWTNPDGLCVDVVCEEPDIGPLEDSEKFFPRLKVLSFDLESDKESGRVYCVSFVMKTLNDSAFEDEKKESIIVSNEEVRGAKSVASEKELIDAFSRTVREWDPDVITGWNVIDFDLHHLSQRASSLKTKLLIGRDSSEANLRIQSSFFRDSTATVQGRVVIDGIQALKGAFIKLPDYKLATAAEKYSDDKKLIEVTGKQKYEEINRLYEENREELVKYNMMDAKLVLDILEKSSVLGLVVKRSLLTGMPLDRVNASIAVLDSLYLRELRKRGRVAPTSGQYSESRGIGGFVMQPKPGIYNYVIVCDFKSLYPSIMRTFNIDPMTFIPESRVTEEMIKNKEVIPAPNNAFFSREPGIIPGIIERFWKAREQARKHGDELARYAIKIHMNSIYGVLASPNCRFFNRKIGNAITSFAQHFIKMTAAIVREKGYEVIYGDTDSIFIDLEADSYEEAQRIGRQIEEGINIFLREHIKREYRLESYMEMEFEKTFIALVIPKMRGSDSGAKKRYAGLVLDSDGKEKITFTGLESVRRDWTDLAKEFQHELYRRVFKGEEVASFVRKFIKEIREGKHDSKLVYRKALRKDVDEYTKTTPPHVKAARMLDRIESSIIEYVITTNGPEPVQKRMHPIDYDHYIEKQVKPIADSVLELYGTSFDDQLQGSTQKSIFDF
ncbi:DNA polymerase II [Candidatus Woesearchaeota archaeon]|nr:MAG: DNA polymerase II [Candidatus Woesearchaeota archaeon]